MCVEGGELDTVLCFIMCWSFEKGSGPENNTSIHQALQYTEGSNNNVKLKETEYLTGLLSWEVSAKAPGFGKAEHLLVNVTVIYW